MTQPVDPILAHELSNAPRKHRTEVLFRYMKKRGAVFYDENVTQLEHALQCAHHTRQQCGTPHEIVAALLHDFGHILLVERAGDGEHRATDWEHEDVGGRFLEAFFPAAVTAPIRLHVPAKRYLCAVEPEYYERLSEASRHSLGLQGGRMSAGECVAFERNAHFVEAVKLRRWDDLAKTPGLEVPGLDAYRAEVDACWR